MAVINEKRKEAHVQLYNYVKTQEYYVIVPGLFWSADRLVKVDRLEDVVTLQIDTRDGKVPDKILFNGKEVKLVNI